MHNSDAEESDAEKAEERIEFEIAAMESLGNSASKCTFGKPRLGIEPLKVPA